MLKLKNNITGIASKKLDFLSQDQIEAFFHKSRQWNLAPALSSGGSVIFPHTLIETCGDQVAAAVRGCLDCGAPRVIVLGVLHSHERQPIIDARKKVQLRQDISQEPFWGILGPRFPGDRTWETEYSLFNFAFLWDYEVKKRNLKNPPELILAYPCLANREPEKLPGMELLKSYLPNSVIVATTDFCHYGRGYETPDDRCFPISKKAEEFAAATISRGLHFLAHPDYSAYIDYSTETIADGADVGQVLTHLKGALQSKILDMRLVDTAHLFENDPAPSWVAATLVELTL